MRKGRLLAGIIVVFIVLLVAASRLAVDWQWFSVLGFLDLRIKPFVIQTLIYVLTFGLGAAFVFFNFRVLTSPLLLLKNRVDPDDERYVRFVDRLLSFRKWGVLIASLLIGFFFASSFHNFWLKGAYFFFGGETGTVDPVFQQDVSFYMFQLPFISHIVEALLGLVVFVLIVSAAVYFLTGVISWRSIKSGIRSTQGMQAMKHINILTGLLLLFLAANAFLGRYELLFSARGAIYGAGFADLNVTLYVYTFLALLGAVGFILSIINLKLFKFRLIALALAVFIGISVIGGIAGTAVQAVIVSPNELTRERPFIEHHLEMTRSSYNLDKIEERTWEVEVTAEEEMEGIEDIEEPVDPSGDNPMPDISQEVMNNARLLDHRPAKEVYRQAQEYRRYYEFKDVDVARYRIDGEYHQVMIAAREMNVARLPDEAQTAVNRHLKYTHGYGFVMSPVGDFTEGGFPEYYVKDMPLVDELGLGIERLELYFGELTDQFVIVNTDEREFNYPGQEEVEMIYEGEDGIEMNTLNRILFAVREGSSFILFSQEYSSESQILINRNITERVNKIAPFLEYDEDPYLAAADGRLYWIIDAYVTSEDFPYSRPYSGRDNYLRNPVKAVVDAYSGEVSYYLVEEDEPYTEALDRIFPDLFSDPEEAPEDLRAQFRYPYHIFNIQADMLRNYHMTNPNIFYNREDAWDFSKEIYRREATEVEPYYVSLDLPEGEETEFVLMSPFTPVQRNNMIAWLGARNDGEAYGELILYRFPAGELVYGTQQIDARIDQHPEISEQFTLWDTGGSNVIRGNLLAIPLEEGVLYIEPIYLEAEGSAFPEMRRVIVAWGDNLVMEDSLREALEVLGAVHEEEVPPEEIPEEVVEETEERLRTITELVQKSRQLHQEANEALKEGNWARYGEIQEELGEVLEELEERTE